MKKVLFAITVSILLSASAFAWPSCSGTWIQVPTGTSSANGVIEVTGDHLTFQCQKTPQGDPVKTTNNNTNTNNSNSNSSAGASSTSSSGASATGGNATATGGNASQDQKQGQSQSSNNQNQSSATNSGNNSSYSSTTNIAAPKIPVTTAYAPTSLPSAPCVKGFGAGIQTMPVGGSFGGSKIDDGCDARETARSYALLGSKLAACKILVGQKKSKKAGVTLEDCMYEPPAPAPVLADVPLPTPPQEVRIALEVKVVQPLPVLHDEITVVATKAQVRAASRPRAFVKRTTKNCVTPESLKTPMEK